MEYYKVEEREENAGSGSDIREYQGKSETKKVSLVSLNFACIIQCKNHYSVFRTQNLCLLNECAWSHNLAWKIEHPSSTTEFILKKSLN